MSTTSSTFSALTSDLPTITSAGRDRPGGIENSRPGKFHGPSFAIETESLVRPITILSTPPSAGIGALLLLMAVHMNISVIALIGIILLIGIVKKNGIMLVDRTRARAR